MGRPNSYHHCTLLVDVNKMNLGEVLHKFDVSTSRPSFLINIRYLFFNETNYLLPLTFIIGLNLNPLLIFRPFLLDKKIQIFVNKL